MARYECVSRLQQHENPVAKVVPAAKKTDAVSLVYKKVTLGGMPSLTRRKPGSGEYAYIT